MQVRCLQSGEIELWHRVVQAGFKDQDELGPVEAVVAGFSAEAAGNRFFLATVDGEPAGQVLGCFQRVGVLSGTSVLPRFRGLGAGGP